MPTVKKSRLGKHVARRKKASSVEESRHLSDSDHLYPQVTVDALPDDVLLEIFDFYLLGSCGEDELGDSYGEDAWQTVPRWCTSARSGVGRSGMSQPQDAKNIISALKQHSRVCKIDLDGIPNTFLKKIRAMKMRNAFSALTRLWLSSRGVNAPALPDSFLGGAAPRLQQLRLDGISFPALPKLLLSTLDLVELSLWGIRPPVYISTEAVVTCLSALTRLQTLNLNFRSPRSRADQVNRLRPRLTRVVLPALADFYFKGDGEYLDDIVAQIDTPRLKRLAIAFFTQLIFDTPLLRYFISRTETVKLFHQAEMKFNSDDVSFSLSRQEGNGMWRKTTLSSMIVCRPLDWQLSSLAQICDLASFPLPTVDRLEISSSRTEWQDDMENIQWLEVLDPFTSVKDLVLHGNLIQPLALALEDLIGGGVTEVLPALQNIFLWSPQPSESVKRALGKFVATRQLSGRSVTVHHKEARDQDYGRWEVGN